MGQIHVFKGEIKFQPLIPWFYFIYLFIHVYFTFSSIEIIFIY